ncbi:MAG: hypothetical protein ABI684_01030 [Nitrospirota bacterium]
MSAEPLIEGPVSPLRLLAAYLGTSAIGEAIQTERDGGRCDSKFM